MSELFSILWRIFQVESPILGLTFGEIWLGIFVVGIGSHILRSSFSLAQNGRHLFKSSSGKYRRKAENDD